MNENYNLNTQLNTVHNNNSKTTNNRTNRINNFAMHNAKNIVGVSVSALRI